jgi:hypothetical protein
VASGMLTASAEATAHRIMGDREMARIIAFSCVGAACPVSWRPRPRTTNTNRAEDDV